MVLGMLILVSGCGDSESGFSSDSESSVSSSVTGDGGVSYDGVISSVDALPTPPGGMELPAELDLTSPSSGVDDASLVQEPAFELPK